MKMQVKDLVEVTLATMPVRVERDNILLIEVCNLFYNGECMLPRVIMEKEIVTFYSSGRPEAVKPCSQERFRRFCPI